MNMTIQEKTEKKSELLRCADRYLDAFEAGDPSRLSVTDDVRLTENASPLVLGEGLWKTVSAVQYRHAVADPVESQIGVFSTLQEKNSDQMTLLALRLKMADKKFTEIETIVTRYVGKALAYKPESLVAPASVLTEVEPVSERLPRDRLAAIADLYFEGLEKNSAEIIQLHKDCNRVENGMQTTNNPDLGFITSLSCAAQIPIFSYITKVRNRRYCVVDEELGLVWCLVMFDVPGTVKTAELPGYGVIDLPARVQNPRSALVAELFKIRQGQIHYIEAFLTGAPLGTEPGWPVCPGPLTLSTET